MSEVQVDPATIRHGRPFVKLKHSDAPDDCPHEWEGHLWHRDEAYCKLCGSFAERLCYSQARKRAALAASFPCECWSQPHAGFCPAREG